MLVMLDLLIAALCALSFLVGFLVRGEIALWRRVRGETLDFTRKNTGT